jgi:hypothetical protein
MLSNIMIPKYNHKNKYLHLKIHFESLITGWFKFFSFYYTNLHNDYNHKTNYKIYV